MWIGIGIIAIALLVRAWLFYEIKNMPKLDENRNIVTKDKNKN